jgi:hypothetical protein
VTSSAQVAKAQLDSLDSKFGIYEKVGTGGTNFVESVKSKYYENVVVGGRSDE